VLSTVKALVSPGCTLKLTHKMLLSTVGSGTTPSGGMKLPGTKVPKEVSQPGMTISHSW
jgi:hypothetical protein